MYCLLCHEKIPRLRAWRTKSEFCSDEHAALYKKQTLERLLTDQNAARKQAPHPLPFAQEDAEELAHDEMSATPSADVDIDRSAIPLPEAQSEVPSSGPDDALPPFDQHEASSSDSVDEFWRLAEGFDGPADAPQDLETADVHEQSAEEALRALRRLAEGRAEVGDSDEAAPLEDLMPSAGLPDLDRELDSMEDLPDLDDDLLAELESGLPDFGGAFDDEEQEPAHASEDSLVADREGTKADDGSPPSILERLMEDPFDSGAEPSSGRAPLEAASADSPPEELAELEDAPEPEFAVDDAVAGAEQPPVEAQSEEEQMDEQPDVAASSDAWTDDAEGEVDPLEELIRAEEAAGAAQSEEAAEQPDETIADELASEPAEEADRDDLDLQQLDRSLKVVPFPSQDRAGSKNGTADHAAEVMENAEEGLEESPWSDEDSPAASAEPTGSPGKPSRSGRSKRVRTRFKPSMVMAGVEPSLQGYRQGDPLEPWRVSAVRAVWGEGGLPEAYGFQSPPLSRIDALDAGLTAIQPDRQYRGRLGAVIAICRPAEAPEIKAPEYEMRAAHDGQPLQAPAALTAAQDAFITLAPEYVPCADAAATSIEPAGPPSGEDMRPVDFETPDVLEPSGLFCDSVPVEERFIDEEDWEAVDDGAGGSDWTEDYTDEEQPATSSAGGTEYR